MSSLPVSRPKSKSLSVAERATLIRCERTAAEGMQQFVKVGNALAEIRDSHLYRETHRTFEQYVRDRWHLDPRHAYRQISAAKVAADLEDAPVQPETPWQCNPLVGVKDPDERREAWDEAVAEAGGSQPPNSLVKAVVERRTAERTVAELVQDVKDAGLVPEDATVTVVLPDPVADEAEAEPETLRELTDAEWLETLPARSKLTGLIRDKFDADAIYYRHTEPIRKRFKDEVRAIRSRVTRNQDTPYVAKELWYFRLNHPGDWPACKVCNGNGIHAALGLGQVCPACHGAGYHIHDGGK